MNIDAYNTAGVGADITNLSFSTSEVRSVIMNIAVYRHTDSGTITEHSTILAVYNADNSPGSLWELSRDYVGDARITFAMSDTGQVSFVIRASDGALAGTNYTGFLSYTAKALLNT